MMNNTFEQEGYVFRDRYPERVVIYQEYDRLSEAARAGPGFAGSFPYGDHPRERFDLFLADKPDAPLVIFFHGGFWQTSDRAHFSFIGEALRLLDMSVALPSYPLCPEVSLSSLLQSTKASVPAVFAKLGQLNLLPSEWSLSGHSAGGHSAAWLAAGDLWSSLPTLARCCAISGIFYLSPIIKTTQNEALGLNEAEAIFLSPGFLDGVGTELYLAVGSNETEAFCQQSEDYAKFMRSRGGKVTLEKLDDYNHHTILQDFLTKESPLAQMLQGTYNRSL